PGPDRHLGRSDPARRSVRRRPRARRQRRRGPRAPDHRPRRRPARRRGHRDQPRIPRQRRARDQPRRRLVHRRCPRRDRSLLRRRRHARRDVLAAYPAPPRTGYTAPVFAVTYLGQQGWLLGSDSTRILIDPLLTDEYSPGFSAVIHPPRRISLAKLPPIDAVVLSHEHADHVSVASLLALDRRIPVFFPERSAVALRPVIQRPALRATRR